MAEPVLRLSGVDLAYDRRPVVRGVDLEVARESFLGIIGPNGSGKTTLLRGLLGLMSPRAGRVEQPSGPVRLGWVKQRQHLDPLFPITAEHFVLMGRHGHVGPFRRPRAADRRIAREALEAVGMAEHGGRLLRELSGGQSQRCLIARALAMEPDVLLLDEPTNDMDVAAEERILRLVGELRRERGLTVVLVSHLLNVVVDHADRLALVSGGRLVEGSRDEMATSERLSEFFGQPLQVSRVGERLAILPGERAGA